MVPHKVTFHWKCLSQFHWNPVDRYAYLHQQNLDTVFGMQFCEMVQRDSWKGTSFSWPLLKSRQHMHEQSARWFVKRNLKSRRVCIQTVRIHPGKQHCMETKDPWDRDGTVTLQLCNKQRKHRKKLWPEDKEFCFFCSQISDSLRSFWRQASSAKLLRKAALFCAAFAPEISRGDQKELSKTYPLWDQVCHSVDLQHQSYGSERCICRNLYIGSTESSLG